MKDLVHLHQIFRGAAQGLGITSGKDPILILSACGELLTSEQNVPNPIFVPNPVFWVNTPRVAIEGVGQSPPNFQGTCPGDGSTSGKDSILTASTCGELFTSE